MIKKLFIMICLLTAIKQLKAQVVEIKPAYPQRGEKVTVIYHPGAKEAIIPENADSLKMQFTSSTFYDLSWEIPMVKQGSNWVISFVPQRYATFGSFYFQSGKLIDKPADRDYTIAVYKGKKRVKDGYYHESFSIKSQMPKAPNLIPMQLELLKKELEGYPDNYEAQIRFQSLSMDNTRNPEEKLTLREEARRIIAAKFKEDPASTENLNKVKMGYRMIGEPSRLDSIRKLVMVNHPLSEPARMYQLATITKEKDTLKMVGQLETLLKQADHAGSESSLAIHKILFNYYASIKNEAQALDHAKKSLGDPTPYTAKELKDIAAVLTANKLASASALNYAERSLKIADQWPVGLIRFFPEFGYIPCFVEDSTRVKTVSEAKSSLYAIIALNKSYLGDQTAALKAVALAEGEALTKESSINIAMVYDQAGNAKKSFDVLWKVILTDPLDTALIGSARTVYLKFNTSEQDFNLKIKAIENIKMAKLRATLGQQLMDKPGPKLIAISDLAGKPLNDEILKGKVVIMDFWATWCVPCMKELPYLQKVYDKYKNNPDVVFMVINSGSGNTIDDARGWAKNNTQYSFPLYFNGDKQIGEKVGFTLIPTIALLDKNGKMQFRNIGFEGAEMEAKLTTQIEILLNAKSK